MLEKIDNTQFFISAVVKNIEDNVAILLLENNQQINWPKDKLPDDATPGQTIKIIIYSNQELEKSKEELSRSILNEILKNG